MMSSGKVVAIRLALIATILAIWEISTGGWVSGTDYLDVYFSSPIKIFAALIENWDLLLSDTIVTVTEAFIGLVGGIVSGVVIAILFGQFETLDRIVEPVFQGLNAIPRPALAPLLIIWFGLGMISKVLVAWSIVFFIVFYNVYSGIKSIDPDYFRTMKVLGASDRQMVRIIVAPAIMSWVFAAFRVSVAYSLLGAVVGEFAGATEGLGYRLIISEGMLATDLLYGIILIMMIIGYSVSAGAKRLENRLLRWRPTAVAI